MAGPWEKYQQADGPWAKYAEPPKKNIIPQTPGDAALARQAYDDSPFWQRALISAGAEFKALGRGIGQLVTPNDSAAHQAITASANADAPFQDAPHGAANLAGRALPYLATIPLGGPEAAVVGRLPQGAGIAARIAARALPAAAEGAAYGAAREVRTGESRAENAGLGALAGVGGRALAGVAGKALAPAKPFLSDSARRLAALAEQYGVPLSPADLSNSPLLRRLANLPGSGRVALAEKQSAAVNREIANTIGVDAPRVDAQVYAAKKVADSRAFNDLTARNNLTVTPDLVRSLKAIQDDANVVGGDAAKAVSNAIDGFYARMDSNGIVPGRAYQSLDGALGGALKSGGENAHYIGQVRSAIRDAMDNSIAPADSEAWATLRQQYGDRKTIRDLVSKGQGEDISPRALMGRVTANNSGKERMASGTRGKLGDLAMLGQQLKPPPTSGTAENELAKKLWNPLNWPGMAATSTAGHLANSPALARRMVAKDAKALAKSLATQSVPRKYAEKYVQGYLARLLLGQHPNAPLELNIVGGSPMPAGQLDAQLRSQGY